MLERVFAFLKDLPANKHAGDAAQDEVRLAVAALLYHVMSADGQRQDVEWETLKSRLSQTYDLEGAALDALVREAVRADEEAIDLYAFTSPIKRHLDEDARKAFIASMYDVVYADGHLHEFEDNIVWRVAELIGVDNRDRVNARRKAAARFGAQDHAKTER